MPTPSPIDHDVQRCRELSADIEEALDNPDIESGLVTSGYNAKELLPHLAAVLAELERLREVERDYLNLLHLEHGERTDADKDPSVY